jgi:hypothetical protein
LRRNFYGNLKTKTKFRGMLASHTSVTANTYKGSKVCVMEYQKEKNERNGKKYLK